jgi:hypothetical protein
MQHDIVIGGTYRHYKRGEHYTVLHLATDSDTEETVVVYQAEYGDKRVFTRRASVFTENVDHEGKLVPRFTHIEGT